MEKLEPVNNFETNTRRPGSDRRRRDAPVGRYDGRKAHTPASGLARTPTMDSLVVRLDEQIARATQAAAERRKLPCRTDEEIGARSRDCQRLEHNAEQLRRRRDALVRSDTTVGAIVDPWGSGDQRLYATIDRRVDVLEMERSHGRITEAAYQTGRQVQAVLERQGKIKSADWAGASRGDPALANELKIILCVMNAQEIVGLTARIAGRIGRCDMRLLRRVIGERVGFADCAAMEGKAGERGQAYIAARFRDALEELADVFAGRGAGHPVPEDAYKAASADMVPRQAAAIAGGTTRRRLEEELVDLRALAAETVSFRNRVRLNASADMLERRLALMPAPIEAGDDWHYGGTYDFADPD